MRALNEIVSFLRSELPSATIEEHCLGACGEPIFLDIELDGRFVAVERMAESRIGVSLLSDCQTETEGLFGAHDGIFDDFDEALGEILDLLQAEAGAPLARVSFG